MILQRRLGGQYWKEDLEAYNLEQLVSLLETLYIQVFWASMQNSFCLIWFGLVFLVWKKNQEPLTRMTLTIFLCVSYKHDIFPKFNQVLIYLLCLKKTKNKNNDSEQVDSIRKTFWMTIMEAMESPQNEVEWMWSHSIQHISKSKVKLLRYKDDGLCSSMGYSPSLKVMPPFSKS